MANGDAKQIRSDLERLWREAKARRLLSRLILAVNFGGRTPDSRSYIKQIPLARMARDIDNLRSSEGFCFGSVVGTGNDYDNNYSENLRNFALRTTDSFSPPNRASTVAFYLSRLLHRRPEYYRLRSVQEILSECDIIKLFRHITRDNILPDAEYDLLWRSARSYSSLSETIISLFNVNPERINETNGRLFRSNDSKHQEGRFLCYRYASTTGFVVKSFLRLERSPTLTGFRHYYIDKDANERTAEGYLLPLQRANYFVSNIDAGAGLKIVVLPLLGIASRFHGLIMTMNSDRQPIVARIVLKRTVHATAADAQIATFPERELMTHIQREDETRGPEECEAEATRLRREMRNEIESALVNQVFNRNDEPIDQPTVLAIVNSALGIDGTPLLKVQKGAAKVPYNPLQKGGLPFNCTLTVGRDAPVP